MSFARVIFLVMTTVFIAVTPLSAANPLPKKEAVVTQSGAKASAKKTSSPKPGTIKKSGNNTAPPRPTIKKVAKPVGAKTTSPAKPTQKKAVVASQAKKSIAQPKTVNKPAASKPAPKAVSKNQVPSPGIKKATPKPETKPKQAPPRPAPNKAGSVSVPKKPSTVVKSPQKEQVKPATNNAPAATPIKSQGKPSDAVVTPKKSLITTPIKSAAANSDKLIIIDAGHGGYDVGARVAACNEKSLALSTSLMAKKYLTEMGYRVILTRSRDIFIPLQRRTTIANQTKSKLFVSVHFNSAKNKDAQGIEVFYYNSNDKWRSGSSKKLAQRVLSRLIARTGAKDRGVKNRNFHVIRETKMPAILVEGGFITHEEERHQLIDVTYRQKLARGIAEGIDNYFKM